VENLVFVGFGKFKMGYYFLFGNFSFCGVLKIQNGLAFFCVGILVFVGF